MSHLDFGGVDDVATALVRLGNQVIPHVEPLLKSKSRETKVAALFVMMGTDAPKLFEYGQALIGDRDPYVRIAAYHATGWGHKPEAIPILLKGLEDSKMYGNFRVSDSVASILAGTFGGGQSEEWAEGRAALKQWQAAHGG